MDEIIRKYLGLREAKPGYAAYTEIHTNDFTESCADRTFILYADSLLRLLAKLNARVKLTGDEKIVIAKVPYSDCPYGQIICKLTVIENLPINLEEYLIRLEGTKEQIAYFNRNQKRLPQGTVKS